jgi:hypothetical protein
MRLLLLLTGLGLSSTVKAQVLAPKVATPLRPADVTEELQNTVNPRFKVLASPTPVYRQAADTLNKRHVFILTPGTRIYLRKALPQGYMISFGGEAYYVPYKLVAGLPTQIEI